MISLKKDSDPLRCQRFGTFNISNQNLNQRPRTPKYIAPSTPDLINPKISSEFEDLKLSKIKKKSITNDYKMEIFDYSQPRIEVRDVYALQTIEELGNQKESSNSNLNITNILPEDEKSSIDLQIDRDMGKNKKNLDYIANEKLKSKTTKLEIIGRSQGIDIAENSMRTLNHESNDIFKTHGSFRIPENLNELKIPKKKQQSFGELSFQPNPENVEGVDNLESELSNFENQQNMRMNVGGERNWQHAENGKFSGSIQMAESEREDMTRNTVKSDNLEQNQKRGGDTTTLDTYHGSRTDRDFEGSKRISSKEHNKVPLDSLKEISDHDKSHEQEFEPDESLNHHIADFSKTFVFFVKYI